MIKFITLYPVRHFVAYKQQPEFLRYLARRDGLLTPNSEAHYCIVHSQKNLRLKTKEYIEPNLVRHFVYVPSYLFRLATVFGWFALHKNFRSAQAHDLVLVINNTFHDTGLHILARLNGWRSLKIMGTFFYHARRGFKKYLVDTFEWLHCFLATQILVISPSGWKYVPKRFHAKTRYYVPDFLSDAPKNLSDVSAPKTSTHSAVCLSRLEPEKGLIDLIDAWATVDPAWQLTIYGDGSLKKILLQRIHDLKVSDRITVAEPIAHENVFTTLAQYDVFVLTSPCEGLGISYLEALYMRIPCVGLDVPGVRDTLANGRGVLLPNSTWKSRLNEALEAALALATSSVWYESIETYFANEVVPRINPGTSSWFDQQRSP